MAAPPDALLLMGRQCPYCPTVLKHLQALQAEGAIGALETVVLDDHPEQAARLGVRSVPWVRIGSFELPGLRSEQELREWAARAGAAGGQARYLEELLASGELDKCVALLRADHGALQGLLQRFTDPDVELNVRIGISAVMETLAGTPALLSIAEPLRALLSHPDARVRGDACHYLALSGAQHAADWIRPLLEDDDHHVREIAADSLEELTGIGT
ncbi:MAG: HEAT repeat domain-containing protein [Pseudomonadota bacterium]